MVAIYEVHVHGTNNIYAPCDSSPRKYSLVKENITNDYVPITTYLCILYHMDALKFLITSIFHLPLIQATMLKMLK